MKPKARAPEPNGGILTVKQCRAVELAARLDKQIGAALGISIPAVRKRLGAAMEKLGATDRHDLIRIVAYSEGFLAGMDYGSTFDTYHKRRR